MTQIENDWQILDDELLAALPQETSPPTIEGLRAIIDGCDEVILDAIMARTAAVQHIGELKLSGGLPVRDIGRENEILRALKQRTIEKGGDPAVVNKIWGDVLFHDARLSQQRLRLVGRPALENATEDN